MRFIKRAVATTLGALTLTIVAATPAAASPEDGQGCVGTPGVPDAYVCVISLTPENGAPDVDTSTTVPVTVPAICYFLGCTQPTVVGVPVPAVTPNAGTIAVLWYRGQYIPIAIRADIDGIIAAAIATVDGAVATVRSLEAEHVAPTVAYAETLLVDVMTLASSVADDIQRNYIAPTATDIERMRDETLRNFNLVDPLQAYAMALFDKTAADPMWVVRYAMGARRLTTLHCGNCLW